MDSLREIQKQCLEDSERWFGEDRARNLTIYALGLAGESGEFCDELKKVMRGSKTMDEAAESLAVELTDIFIYVCNIAELFGIDLGEIYDRKRAFNAKRFDPEVREAEAEPVGEGG